MIRKFYDGAALPSGGGSAPESVPSVHTEVKETFKEEVKKISVTQLYDFIVSKMTPEEALKKLLSSTLLKYEKLKIQNPNDMVHPEIIIAMAALDLGWDIAVEDDGDKNAQVQGLVVGTPAYMNRIFKKKKEES